jgi:hypothetical protein|tara:strand:+ start:280 stop:522 length:243 start_codon:yes stop_codon:yes gene_type:complete
MAKSKVKKASEQVYTSDYNEVTFIGDEMSGATYNLGSLGQLDFDYDNDLRDKYPALKDAWEHYNTVKQMCESKEKESDEN